MLRRISRITIPGVAGGLAFGLFPFRKSQFNPNTFPNNEEIAQSIKNTDLFKRLKDDPEFTQMDTDKQFPQQHLRNYVSSGLLYGKDLFETKPVVFFNKKSGEFFAFHHIGKKLVSDDGKIHNGITATLLDEGLCAAGFPFLPSKKGVTAKLSIDFENQVTPNSIVAVKANVVEHKGRKVVINGSLESLDHNPTTIATANCILVEPKWFRYFSWFQFI